MLASYVLVLNNCKDEFVFRISAIDLDYEWLNDFLLPDVPLKIGPVKDGDEVRQLILETGQEIGKCEDQMMPIIILLSMISGI